MCRGIQSARRAQQGMGLQNPASGSGAQPPGGRREPFAALEVGEGGDVKRVRVPASAVVTNGERSVVFVAREPGRLERVPVTVGRRRDGEVDLRSGLDAGSRYVARGALLLENTIELAD